MFKEILLLLSAISSLAFAQDCSVPKERGYGCHDAGMKQRFFYDQESGVCIPFLFLGCGGNGNSFATFDECNKVCIEKKLPQKHEPKKKLTGEFDTLTVDVCDVLTDAKIREVAQSCSKENDGPCKSGYDCVKGWCCPSKAHICELPSDSGDDNAAFHHYGRYVYTPGLKNCLRFSYFGEAGNYNNFKTYKECLEFCGPKKPSQEKKRSSTSTRIEFNFTTLIK